MSIIKNKMKKIKIYSTPSCPYCHLAKEFLKENKVDFKDINVLEDQAAAEEMTQKTGQFGVPVIIITDEDGTNEKIMIGFDRGELSKAAGISAN